MVWESETDRLKIADENDKQKKKDIVVFIYTYGQAKGIYFDSQSGHHGARSVPCLDVNTGASDTRRWYHTRTYALIHGWQYHPLHTKSQLGCLVSVRAVVVVHVSALLFV